MVYTDVVDDPYPAEVPKYTSNQIQAYYERIKLPASYRVISVASIANTKEGLDFLTVLQHHQLAAVPFENLELHYSSHHTISIDPEHLFHKIVDRNAGRGGYCMENNCFFGTILRTLGFDVFAVGAKVNSAMQAVSSNKNWKGPKYGGWSHMLNIVTINEQRYMIDVGFGSGAANDPIPMINDYTAPLIGKQEMRLIYDTVPDFTNKQSKLWQYQHRNGSDKPWIPTYAFSDMEFTPSDFLVMNYSTSTNRKSWFTHSVVCRTMILEDGELVGDITLFNDEVKKRVRDGDAEVIAKFQTESERVKALDGFLGVKLSQVERAGIRGLRSEIL
ncbi:N-acetyltransferase [Phlyctema vagabunda]|uniref:N-acetyltransferase n=1 Tax=Phlyctema vagabunda TaxID=108571 RepID=A0ABR4PPT7_9HELO